MRCPRPLLLAAAAALVLPATAQSKKAVIPFHYTGVEGPGSSEAPGDWSPVHMQAIYEKSKILIGNAALKAVAFRRNQDATTVNAHTQQVVLEISSRGVPAPEFSSPIYETNRGTDHVKVFQGNVSFPLDTGGNGPRPFAISLPFSAPFPYPTGNHLLLEVGVIAAGFVSNKWAVDGTPGIVLSPTGTFQKTGQGCPTTFGIDALGAVPQPGGALILFGNSGDPALRPAALFVGVQQVNVPLDPIGADKCSLYVNPLLVFPGQSSATGVVEFDLGRIPADSGWKGAKVTVQSFVVSPGHNNANLRASLGNTLTFGQGFPAGLEAHAWYDRRDNLAGYFRTADFRSTRTPILEVEF